MVSFARRDGDERSKKERAAEERERMERENNIRTAKKERKDEIRA